MKLFFLVAFIGLFVLLSGCVQEPDDWTCESVQDCQETRDSSIYACLGSFECLEGDCIWVCNDPCFVESMGFGLCEMAGMGFEYNNQTNECKSVTKSGCSFYFPFTSLEECKTECVKETEPVLIFSKKSGWGPCEGEDCYYNIDIYSDGAVVEQNGSQENLITITTEEINQIKNKIFETDVMEKECEFQIILDYIANYKINLDGQEKEFTYPECDEELREIDLEIEAIIEKYAGVTEKFFCETDSDCEVKDVHNCCGYFPGCVNKDFEPDIDAVIKKCEEEGLGSVCGFPEISHCKCIENTCTSMQGDGIV